MPKGLLHIACSVLILLNGMGYSIIQTQFLLQRKEITAIYCINKDKPEMACGGKCELSKRLSAEKDRTEDAEGIVLKELTLSYILPQFPVLAQADLPVFQEQLRTPYRVWAPMSESMDFFHPPTC